MSLCSLNKAQSAQKGFTLVELLWVISLLFVVITAIYLVLEVSLVSQKSNSEQAQAALEARKAMDVMTKYLREGLLIEADPYLVRFRADIDNDDQWEVMAFSLDGTTLLMNREEATTTLADFLRNLERSPAVPLFTYYGETTGTTSTNLPEITDPVSDLRNIRNIQIHLITDVNTSTLPGALVLQSRVRMRNWW